MKYRGIGKNMKTQLTSIDLCILAKELDKILSSARIDKVYQIGKRELKLKVHVSGTGYRELIIAPGYVCITQFPRKVPEKPSPFAMQLRKNLSGGFIRGVRQHNFDRILEFLIEKKDGKFLLIAEFFSRGNVILCDHEGKILGLLEWQEWKDRKLVVGRRYEYPPEVKNPLEINSSSFKKILGSSEKKLVVVMAIDMGLSGVYAEEVCLISKIEKERNCNELSNNEVDILFDFFKKVIEKIKGEEIKPMMILKEGKPVDVIPFDLRIYENFERKEFESFNEAVDEYFSKEEFAEIQKEKEEKFQEELKKLRGIEEKQKRTIEKLEKKSLKYREIGDLIYQNFQVIEKILRVIKEERKKGGSWEDIQKKFAGKELGGIKIEKIDKKGYIILCTPQ